MLAVLKQMFRPLHRNLVVRVLGVLVVTVAFFPLVVIVVHQLSSPSPRTLADVDVLVVVVEEHHEGKPSQADCMRAFIDSVEISRLKL